MTKAKKADQNSSSGVNPTLVEKMALAKAAMTKQREVPTIAPIKVKRVGRPTKYTPEIVKKAYEYIDACEDTYYNYQKGFGSTDTFERKVVVRLPTRDGLALFLGLHRDTLKEWDKEHKAFSAALEFLDQKQKEMLIRGGMSGDYNPTIAKLVLSANHGMKERVDNTSDDKPLPPAQVTINNISNLSDDELIALTQGGESGAGS